MGLVDPTKGRAQITDTGMSTIIKIPSKAGLFHTLFVSFILVMWFYVASRRYDTVGERWEQDPTIITLLWLAFWTAGILFTIFSLFWMLFGAEVITVTSGRMTIAKRMLGLGTSKEYDLASAERFRILPPEREPQFSFWSGRGRHQSAGKQMGLTGGQIAFDYGLKTVKFGIKLDDAEARHVLEYLRDRGYIRREDR